MSFKILNCTVLYLKGVKRVDLKNFHHKKKNVYLRYDGH